MNKISLDDNVGVELSDDIIDLMHSVRKLTEKQAEQTLDLFPDLEYSIPIAKYFFSHKEVMIAYSSYSNYLSNVHRAMNPVESIFEEEVRCRSCGLSDKVLDLEFSTNYKRSPWRNSHQDQHFASQDPAPGFDESLVQTYFLHRILTGL